MPRIANVVPASRRIPFVTALAALAVMLVAADALDAFTPAGVGDETYTWTELVPPAAPPARGYHRAALNATTNRMIIFGGGTRYHVPGMLNDTWVLSNADGSSGTPAWTSLSPGGFLPTPRGAYASAYDEASNRLIVYGGNRSISFCGGELGDVWVLSNADGTGGSPTWTQLAPLGAGPGARHFSSAVYDPATNRLIVFGGSAACGVGSGDDGIWILSNANGLGGAPAWTRIQPAGEPTGLKGAHESVYDRVNNRMILFGGCTHTAGCDDETWVLSNANGVGGTPTWTRLSPTGQRPAPRTTHTAVYDAAANRLLVYGGGGTVDPDVWILSNANGLGGTPAWSKATLSGPGPRARFGHAGAWNTTSRRFTLHGGFHCPGGQGACPDPFSVVTLNDVWVLRTQDDQPSAPTQTSLAASPSPSSFGQPVTFTATVTSGGAPVVEGTVTFKEGTTVLAGPVAVNASGQATFETATLTLGSNTVVAEYGGTATFDASSDDLVQVVQCPVITLSPSSLPDGTVGVAYSQTITASGSAGAYTYTVVGSLPDGIGVSSSGVMSGTPTSPGSFTFTVTATDSQGCTGSRTYTVLIPEPNRAPIAVPGGPYTADLGAGFTLDGSGSTDPDTGDAIVLYEWDFRADGTVEVSSPGPVVAVGASLVDSLGGGAHTVRLRVTDSFGVTGSASTTLFVYDNRPIAHLAVAPNPAACGPAVTLNGAGSSHGRPDRTLVRFTWDFGDGSTYTETAASAPDGAFDWRTTHSYQRFGTYTATLTVTDNNVPPKTSTASVVVTVNQGNHAPVAAAGGPYVIDFGAGLTLHGAGSSDADASCGDSITYQWDLNNDGSFSDATGATPALSAAELSALGVGAPGTYTVGLRVVDTFGATGTASTTLTIYDNRPTAHLAVAPNPAACGPAVTLNGAGSVHGRPDRTLVRFTWDFGDGSTYTETAASAPDGAFDWRTTHSYQQFGTYTATLTVTDNNVPPKTSTASVVVTVNQGNHAPVAAPGGPYVIDFGAGVTLNGGGSSDANASCGDSIVSYQWDLNNDGSADAVGPTPTPSAAALSALGLGVGQHTIRLVVVDEFGATGTASTTLTIYDNRPTARLTVSPNPAACGPAVTLDGSASSHGRADRMIVRYAWNFGDGSPNAETAGPTIIHSYQQFGTYTATLTVTDDNVPPKTSTASVVVTVNQGNHAPVAAAGGPYVIDYGAGLTLNDAGSSDSNASCGDSIVSYQWDLNNDGSADAVGATPTLSAAALDALGLGVGQHTIRLVVIDEFGATGTASTTLTIRDTIPPAGSIVSPTSEDLITASPAIVNVHASDAIGVAAVAVNGVAAVLVSGTPQSGTWQASVPVTLPVPSGSALNFSATVTDLAGNTASSPTVVVDNDGIASVVDAQRVCLPFSGCFTSPQETFFSSSFYDGTSYGTVTRNGWTTVVTDLSSFFGVNATISGSGTVASVVSCVNVTETQLDVAGESAEITCMKIKKGTGTVDGTVVRAALALPEIIVRECLTKSGSGACTDYVIKATLTTGQTVGVGSVINADEGNTAPIVVEILDPAGDVIGRGTLAAGESIDIDGAEDGAIVVTNLGAAPVTFTLDGQTLVLPPGASVTDHCPGTSGDVGSTGCPFAVKTTLTLHTVNQGGGPSARAPLAGVRLRLFDLDDPAVTSVTGGGTPQATTYVTVFDTAPVVSGCTTDADGACSLGASTNRDYVLIAKYEDPDTGKTVYVGRVLSAGDFFDGLAEVSQQIMKVLRRGTFEEYRGGSHVLVVP